jgi:hypothetical protein
VVGEVGGVVTVGVAVVGLGVVDGLGVGELGRSTWTWNVNFVPVLNVAPVCQLKFTR